MSEAAPALEDLLEDVTGIGPSTAAVIAEEFDGVDDLADVVTDLPDGYSPARLSNLEGFGPKRAREIAIAIDDAGVLEGPDLYWGKPGQARVNHIFGEDGRSLCMKYGFFPSGRGTSVKHGDVHRSGDDCTECSRKCELVTVANDGEADDE